MNKKKNKKQQKEKKKYRLLILEENTYQPLFGFPLSKINILFYFGGIFVIFFLLSFLAFKYTPMKNFFYTSSNITETELIQSRLKIDSLSEQLAIMDKYFNRLRYILSGQNLDSISVMDSSGMSSLLVSKTEHDSILKVLKTSKQDFSELQTVILSDNKYKNIHFKKPLDGIVSNNFNPADGHYGIDIVAPEKTPVLSILPGTVILAAWSIDNGYIIEIQHENNIISVYKHNAEILKHEGDRVLAGEAIALVGNTGEQTTGTHLHFELWVNGVPVNPTDYIIF